MVLGGVPTCRVPVAKDSNLLIWSKSISSAFTVAETSGTAPNNATAITRRWNLRSLAGTRGKLTGLLLSPRPRGRDFLALLARDRQQHFGLARDALASLLRRN